MSSRWIRRAAALVAVLGVTLTIAAPAQAAPGTVHDPISGTGSSWSANAIEQWNRNVWSNYQRRVQYNNQGSTIGRQAFRDGTADFGVSEIPYELRDSDAVDPRPARGFAYMPIVAGGTSFMYNLVIGGKKVTNLRLSGENITKIFTNVITMWNDPALQADNPSLALPAIPIVPVVRSDGSGTSAQLSTWMRLQYRGLWDGYCQAVGRGQTCGITSNYPTIPGSRFVARSGSNSVAAYVAASQAVGAITYVEYSYALNSGFPVVKVLNQSGYYTEPTAGNVAVALLQARINEDESSADYLTQDLSGVYVSADPRTYPLSSYSYMIIPTKVEYGFTENKGLTLADYGAYFLCEGQQQADVLGYSPLPINLVQAGQKQIQKIPGGNPQIKGITDCNNPTFSPDGSNKLAQTAPYPSDCDKQGAVQCTRGTGGSKDEETPVSSDGGGGGGGGGDQGGAQTNTTDTTAAAAAAGGTQTGGRAGAGVGAGTAGGGQLVLAGKPVAVEPSGRVTAATALGLAGASVAVGAAVIPVALARRRRTHGTGASRLVARAQSGGQP